MKRKNDSRLRIFEIAESLRGLPDDLELILPHRLFIFETDVSEFEETKTQSESGKYKPTGKTLRFSSFLPFQFFFQFHQFQFPFFFFQKKSRLILLNDLLIVAKNVSKKKHLDLKFKCMAFIQLVQITSIPDGG